MVDGYQFLDFFTGLFVKSALNQDVTSISIKIEKPQVQDCYLVNFIG